MPDADVRVSAVRFAIEPTTRSDTFLRYGEYGSPDAAMMCHFYFWVVTGPQGTLLLDTGFGAEVGRRRGQHVQASVEEGLDALGLDVADVDVVVLSHLHFDHTGSLDRFHRAEVVVQDAEIAFWTGPLAQRRLFADVAEPDHLAALGRVEGRGRVRRLRGDTELAAGLTAIDLAGHTAGTQGLRVEGPHGTVVLAADALHYMDEVDRDMPFFIVQDLAGMYRSYDRLARLRDSGDVLVPGHDEDVLHRFPTRTLHSGAVVVTLL